MIPVHFPGDPYVDHEALAAEKAFREFVTSREFPAWAALERARAGYAQLDAHVKAWRERRGKR